MNRREYKLSKMQRRQFASHSPSTLFPHNKMFCGFKSKWAMYFLCRCCNAFSISCMHIRAWASLNEPSSSSIACSSPPVANSKSKAVSIFVSCTECNLTMCFESAHSIKIAISWPISFNVHCARRLRLKNFAAKLTPVFLCTARRTAANLPLQWMMRKRVEKERTYI